MRSVGTTLAAAVMATVLTSSTKAFGGIPFPTEGAFKWCFALGALAAFAGRRDRGLRAAQGRGGYGAGGSGRSRECARSSPSLSSRSSATSAAEREAPSSSSTAW